MGYLLWLQSIRSDTLNVILMGVTDFITSPVMYLGLAILYWCYSKKAAYYIAMNLSVGSMVNQALKNTFCVYRPWIRNPKIKPYPKAIESATGYSFPSGHTQVGASEFLSIAVLQKKRRWLVVLCVTMTLLVMFTRNYLGVHTPEDVIVSLAVSMCVIFISGRLLNWVDGARGRDLAVFAVGMLLCAAFLAYITLKSYPIDYNADGAVLVPSSEMITDCYAAAGCVIGFLCGWICERRFVDFSTDVSGKIKAYRAIPCSLGLLVIALFARDPMQSVHMYWGELAFFAVTFFYILYICPMIFTKIERARKNA